MVVFPHILGLWGPILFVYGWHPLILIQKTKLEFDALLLMNDQWEDLSALDLLNVSSDNIEVLSSFSDS